jgi:hypothetical protein
MGCFGLLLTRLLKRVIVLIRNFFSDPQTEMKNNFRISPAPPRISPSPSLRQVLQNRTKLLDYTINRDDYTRFYESAILGMNLIAATTLNRKIVWLHDYICDFDYHAMIHRHNGTSRYVWNLSYNSSYISYLTSRMWTEETRRT